MNQDAFERQRRKAWDSFRETVESSSKINRKITSSEVEPFLAAYKALNRDLALAQSRGYSQELIDDLNALVSGGHRLVHIENKNWWDTIWSYLSAGFPQEIRESRNYVFVALATFLLPAVFLVFLIETVDSTYLYNVMSPANLEKLERMYDPANEKLGRPRASDTDFQMFGFYIYNNISIALRTFAWGLVFGIGAVLILFFNGVYLGAIFYHLTNIGFSSTLYTFVIAHGSLELTGIVFSGAAGLILGFALLKPGNKSRGEALKLAATRAIRIMVGVVVMLVLAAFIEAFWSSIRWFPDWVKYAVGGTLWVLVLYYFLFVGRRAT